MLASRARSEPQLLQSRRHIIGDHIGGAIPGYLGHVPGHRVEVSTLGGTFRASVEACRAARSRPTADAQVLRQGQAREEPESGTSTSRWTAQRPAAPTGFAATQEDVGSLRGYSSAAKGIPSYGGYIPGKHAENIFASGWSKAHERSLAAHFEARSATPKDFNVVADGNTMVASLPSDALREMPLKNPSYNDRARGWSTCKFTGTHIEPAGRLAPLDRQDGFGAVQPSTSLDKTRGYTGWVPGKVGENVVGERASNISAMSAQLVNENRMRIMQR